MFVQARERTKLLLTDPNVSSFLDALADLYPERSPSPNEDLRSIDIETGKREVVRFLLRLREEAYEEARN
ncbi:MAG: hypothetical protein GEU78_10325 [Actinobacteria bacterium]|nr:hypothetical protein [Actinomycetota bacterium]